MSNGPSQAEMLALAALAYTSATIRPSGETVAAQTARILAGINRQLPSVAPAWEATWVGLTPDRANLVYIAEMRSNPSTVTVVLRGTVVSAVDVIQDLDVQTLVPFAVGFGAKGMVARGSMQAFADVAMGTGFLGMSRLGGATTVYLTGHSLGGALVTMVSFLIARALPNSRIVPFTFAAPSAGDKQFATEFDQRFQAGQRVVNKNDVVPYAWEKLSGIPGLFPNTDSWTITPGIFGLVTVVTSVLGTLPYAQPKAFTTLDDYTVKLPSDDGSSYEMWFAEAEFQHETSTYFRLLKAPLVPPVEPTVRSVSPTSGRTAGGTMVTITGTGFDSSSVVDFGVSAAGTTTVSSATSISAVSPTGIGSVDVRVTTALGTSAPSEDDRFTFTVT